MYNTMRTQKLKDRKKVSAAASHNFRIRHQGNVDASRTPDNEILLNSLGADLSRAEGLQEALSDYYRAIGAKENKNSVLAQEFVISASPEFFRAMKPSDVKKWAQEQVEFMKNEFGDNLKVAVLHLDEKTPHLHLMLSTEKKTVKAYKNQHGAYSKETVSLNANRWGPEFLKGLHDRHAKHNAHYGLKRGKKGSEAIHKPVKDYYRDLQALAARMEGRVNQLEMIPELVGIIEVMADTIENLDPPNSRLAKMARLASSVVAKVQNKPEQEHGGPAPQPPRVFGKGGG